MLGLAGCVVLAGCGTFGIGGQRGASRPVATAPTATGGERTDPRSQGGIINPVGGLGGDDVVGGSATGSQTSTLFDLFTNNDDPNVTLEVNKYLWVASMQVLDFLPIESADPFSGVLVTGYGTPPGGGRAYRATIYVQDPALDARALNVALMTRSGPAAPATTRAVEDAILTRARQLRIRDGRL